MESDILRIPSKIKSKTELSRILNRLSVTKLIEWYQNTLSKIPKKSLILGVQKKSKVWVYFLHNQIWSNR